jgi:hypothetical protein
MIQQKSEIKYTCHVCHKKLLHVIFNPIFTQNFFQKLAQIAIRTQKHEYICSNEKCAQVGKTAITSEVHTIVTRPHWWGNGYEGLK